MSYVEQNTTCVKQALINCDDCDADAAWCGARTRSGAAWRRGRTPVKRAINSGCSRRRTRQWSAIIGRHTRHYGRRGVPSPPPFHSRPVGTYRRRYYRYTAAATIGIPPPLLSVYRRRYYRYTAAATIGIPPPLLSVYRRRYYRQTAAVGGRTISLRPVHGHYLLPKPSQQFRTYLPTYVQTC